MKNITLIKKLKLSGNQVCISFTAEEKECYQLNKNDKIQITIKKIEEK